MAPSCLQTMRRPGRTKAQSIVIDGLVYWIHILLHQVRSETRGGSSHSMSASTDALSLLSAFVSRASFALLDERDHGTTQLTRFWAYLPVVARGECHKHQRRTSTALVLQGRDVCIPLMSSCRELTWVSTCT
jgi:hypothetical protein